MKKKPVFSAFFIGMLLSFSVFGINYLPIFGKFIATAYAEKYVMAQYGEELKYPCRYDLYNGHYTGEMAEGSSIVYSIRSNTLTDYRLSGKVQRRAVRDYELYEGLPSNIQKSGSPHISVSFKANDWEKKSYGLYMGVRNTEKITAEESPERAAETAAYIMEDLWPDYNFTSVQFIYYDINGVYEVNCRDKKGIILEKMLENVSKKPANMQGELYEQWRESVMAEE